ncbi:MAG: TIM44-like domain-containing protein [Bacillota bacterium]
MGFRGGRIKRLLAFVLACCLIAVIAVGSLADAGGFAGDSDYGSSGGSSDWGSSSDWDSSGSSSGGFIVGSDDSGGFGGFGFTSILVIIVIVYVVYRASQKGAGAGRPVAPGASYSTPQGRNIGVAALQAEDPNFSEQAFLEGIANRYVKLQQAWMAKDWEPMRMLMTDALYAQFERQLGDFIRNRQTNRVERIAVLGARILGCWRDDVNDILTIELRTRIVDYVVDDMTGNVVRGDPNRELFMTYEWTLVRSIGVKTDSFEGERKTSCPSCGAPVLLNASNRCTYCGTLISASEHDWVISAIRGISQRSS